MSEPLRFPIRMATLAFALAGILRTGKLFHRMSSEQQREQVARWRGSRLPMCADFVRFYESLAVVALFSRPGIAELK